MYRAIFGQATSSTFGHYRRAQTGDTDKALELNAKFSSPLSRNEVIQATKSAEQAYKLRFDKNANQIAKQIGYPFAGYNLKNKTIIEWLDIINEEQKILQTIISREEKLRIPEDLDTDSSNSWTLSPKTSGQSFH